MGTVTPTYGCKHQLKTTSIARLLGKLKNFRELFLVAIALFFLFAYRENHANLCHHLFHQRPADFSNWRVCLTHDINA